MGITDNIVNSPSWAAQYQQPRKLSPYYFKGRQLYEDELPGYAVVQDATGWHWQLGTDPNTGQTGFLPVSPIDQDRLLAMNDPDYDPVPGPGSSGSPGRDAAQQALDYAQIKDLEERRAIERERLAIEREEIKRREAEARLNALQENLRHYNTIQPDNFRLGIGQNLLNNNSTTPIMAYGNQLQQNIQTLQSGGPLPQPAVMPAQGAAGTGMAQGGMVDMGGMMGGMDQRSMIPSPNVTMGSTRRGVLVGDREINGDEELVVFDVAKPGNFEVIPIMGRAAEGATVNTGPTTPDVRSAYGILSPLYQPFGITSAGAVPTKTNATPTSLGYVNPVYNTDFAPVQPAAYGAFSSQYFDRLTGMLLPNPSTILRQLRILRAQNPVAYAEIRNAYEASTNAQGQPSGLPAAAIDAMLDASAIGVGSEGQGRSMNIIGVR